MQWKPRRVQKLGQLSSLRQFPQDQDEEVLHTVHEEQEEDTRIQETDDSWEHPAFSTRFAAFARPLWKNQESLTKIYNRIRRARRQFGNMQEILKQYRPLDILKSRDEKHRSEQPDRPDQKQNGLHPYAQE